MAEAVDNDLPESLIVTLRKPLIDGKGDAARTITELHLREPTGGECRATENLEGSVAITIGVLALVAGVSEAAIRQLGARDLDKSGSYLARFVVQAAEPYDPETLPDAISFPLRKPLTVAGDTLTVLTLREPTAGQLELYADLEGFARKIKAASVMAAIPDSAAASIGVRDLKQIEAYLDAFF